jgi:dTMP kinase
MSTPATGPVPFIVFEGGEGVGKSTQIAALSHRLTTANIPFLCTREPGATPLGKTLRQVLMDPNGPHPTPRTEALLYAADRAEHVATVVRPALEAGNVVISDRYIDSSVAYQSAGRGLQRDEVLNLSRWATMDLLPTLTIVLDADPTVGQARVRTDEFGEPDRFESETRTFQNQVRHCFLDLATAHQDRYEVIDATLPLDEVSTKVWEAVRPLLR